MKKDDIIDDAINTYRTKHFIVKQNISIQSNNINGTFLFSVDTYLARNNHRDKKYEKAFSLRKNIDGSRLHATSYIRKYVK